MLLLTKQLTMYKLMLSKIKNNASTTKKRFELMTKIATITKQLPADALPPTPRYV